MTVWQDQPPQSRRQVRLNERREASPENQVDIVDQAPDQPAFDAFPNGGWDVESQPAPDAPAAQQHRSRADAAIASGRRSQATSVPATPAQAAGQTDSTQSAERTSAAPGRPQVPSYDGPSFGVSALGSSSRDASSTEENRKFEMPPVADVPQSFRVRDFSPESRRNAFSSTADTETAGTETADTKLNPNGREPVEPSAETGSIWQGVLDAPDQGQPARETASTDRTMTRRELRALRQGEESKGGRSNATDTAPSPAAVPLQSAAAETSAAESPAAETPAAPGSLDAFDALLGAQLGKASPPELVEPTPFAGWPLKRQRSERPQVEDILDAEIVEGAEQSAVVEPIILLEPVSLAEAFAEVDPVPLVEPVAAKQPSSTDSAPFSFTVPTGHWSTQAAVDDDDVQEQASTLSRDVGVTSGAITTNHLVISSVPTATDLFRPFNATGEILITGSIDLPRSLGTTGAHPARYDHSDVDALLEAGDREDSNVDSAPVRAIRAISTHTSTRGVIETTTPPRNSRLPMILAVSTAAVVVAGAGLVVAGMIFNVF
jgi:hypothetical protein